MRPAGGEPRAGRPGGRGRRPMLVGVADLRRRPGTRQGLHVCAVLAGLGVSAARVPEGAEVRIEGLLEAIQGGLSVTGSVSAPWQGECRRCLGPVSGEIRAALAEVFERHPTEGETYPIEGDWIDLECMARDAVLLALPLAPLCREDCAGPAPGEFPTGPVA